MLSATTLSQSSIGDSQIVRSTPIVEAASVDMLTSVATTSRKSVAPENVESYVRAYFSKNPIMAEVARCESQFRQFNKTGSVLRGVAVPQDVGVMQINTYFNGDTAKKLGYDIYTLEGNLAFGQWMYEKQGTQPWSASAACWNK